ncbi:hypothetical protein ASD04_07070 [Devosia sp. Root436]|uniref:helix-turn-helix domain-containing protein n=1 Tax=Devosia sp. Root436 TaxID=1736537 RepID=UPI0006F5284F|nr:transcriptional regulator [Devosia sp. Root436]KQX40384.1 hypothetical protein ASD04_07070 [Devosia sp. Root436]
MTPVDLSHPERPSGPPIMKGSEMKAIRRRLGLSTTELGRAFGYVGQDDTASMTIRRYESGGRDIPPWLARLLRMYDRFGIPADIGDSVDLGIPPDIDEDSEPPD